ncbi:spondin domain-containing protein [Motiliproteus sp. MSK22-1]|uniref:spondin domain-containing protein n=1 Tax=Motiliproteus sp. MSK22-1 TaxID=1897630 RepID=UPI000977BB3C|nr:spondin domain-containing protein [Motiliproteus sp. MSK22-1]OMH34784.1 hypothetical protein BGP75_10790 [Motiliproteus sp. MSK22-1]
MNTFRVAHLLLCGLLGLSISQANAAMIKVEVENKSPTDGLFFTPVWLGFHSGGFDTFDVGAAASPALERLAEDGNPAPLNAALNASQADSIGSVLTAPAGFAGAPIFDPGDIASATFDLDPLAHRYLNYASMLIPSNDAFFGNADPLALFNAGGDFVGDIVISILGANIYDAGTEDNTETGAAFLNQSNPDEGVATTAGLIAQHSGFTAFPGGNVLGGTNGAGFFFDPVFADFSRNNGLVEIAQIRISRVPEPASAALLLAGVFGVGASVRKKRASKR